MMKIMKVAYRECPTRILQVTHQSGTAAIMHEPTATLIGYSECIHLLHLGTSGQYVIDYRQLYSFKKNCTFVRQELFIAN